MSIFAISKVRAIIFIARIPGSLRVLGHEKVYFGIPKYYLVQVKPRDDIVLLRWVSGDL